MKTAHFDTNPPQEELFDLRADPREENNLVADPAQASRLSDLRRRCAACRKTLR